MKFLLFALSLNMSNPDSSLQLSKVATVKHASDFITTDPIGNLYVVKGSIVNKYSAAGDSITCQNFNQIRTIEFFDASQALKIYAVNFSFNAMVILDNTLSAQNQFINLNRVPVDQISLLCASNLNSTMWVFDAVNMQLINVDQNFNLLNASVNFYSHEDLAGIPNYMVESDNKLYLNIPENGIKVFNQFGNFIQNIPVKTDRKFIVRHNKVYYLEAGEIKCYSILDFNTTTIKTSISSIEDFSIEKNKLYIKKGSEVVILDAKFEF